LRNIIEKLGILLPLNICCVPDRTGYKLEMFGLDTLKAKKVLWILA
jgi:hypothetical protein